MEMACYGHMKMFANARELCRVQKAASARGEEGVMMPVNMSCRHADAAITPTLPYCRVGVAAAGDDMIYAARWTMLSEVDRAVCKAVQAPCRTGSGKGVSTISVRAYPAKCVCCVRHPRDKAQAAACRHGAWASFLLPGRPPEGREWPGCRSLLKAEWQGPWSPLPPKPPTS